MVFRQSFWFLFSSSFFKANTKRTFIRARNILDNDKERQHGNSDGNRGQLRENVFLV